MESETAAGSLIALFGEKRFLSDDATLSFYASSINGPQVRPIGVVYPENNEEIVTLLSIAAKKGFTLFPVSKGKNYGYGEAQGTAKGQLIVDLSRMNRILEINDKLAYVTLQPGVSQLTLTDALKKTGLQADVTGSGLSSSVIGNILERGFGHTDYGDRFNRIVNITVITGNGEVLRTGFASWEHAQAARVYRYGFGPVLDGLFTQSNFGIVTEMTIELMPVPRERCMFIVTSRDEKSLGKLVDAVRVLKLNGVVYSAVHFANKSRATGSQETRMAGAWNLSGSVSGPPALVSARKRIVKQTIRQHCRSARIWFVNESLMKFAGWVYRNIMKFELYPALKDAYELQAGIPSDHPLQVLLNDESLQSDTLNSGNYDQCFSWINAVCPAERNSVESLLDLTKQLVESAGYEFRVTFTAINPRSLIMISNITYPRNEQAIRDAETFIKKCSEELVKNGFFPYRSGSGMYDKLPQRSGNLQLAIDRIKSVFDPAGIIAPGKYNIS